MRKNIYFYETNTPIGKIGIATTENDSHITDLTWESDFENFKKKKMIFKFVKLNWLNKRKNSFLNILKKIEKILICHFWKKEHHFRFLFGMLLKKSLMVKPVPTKTLQLQSAIQKLFVQLEWQIIEIKLLFLFHVIVWLVRMGS